MTGALYDRPSTKLNLMHKLKEETGARCYFVTKTLRHTHILHFNPKNHDVLRCLSSSIRTSFFSRYGADKLPVTSTIRH